MGLDLRFPIGLLMGIIGLLMTGYGLTSGEEVYKRSLGINVNLVWGSVLLVFGLVMLYASRRSFSGGGK
ncbi:MAG: hypothetical protein HY820_23705 [Acidobacteria bacterium]|nr:hypothetical protein [Acidobacteriota bacterium]